MSETDASKPSTAGKQWALYGCLVALFYVLSTGPVGVLADRYSLPERQVELFYTPLFMLTEQAPILGDLLERYIEWWQRLIGDGKERL